MPTLCCESFLLVHPHRPLADPGYQCCLGHCCQYIFTVTCRRRVSPIFDVHVQRPQDQLEWHVTWLRGGCARPDPRDFLEVWGQDSHPVQICSNPKADGCRGMKYRRMHNDGSRHVRSMGCYMGIDATLRDGKQKKFLPLATVLKGTAVEIGRVKRYYRRASFTSNRIR